MPVFHGKIIKKKRNLPSMIFSNGTSITNHPLFTIQDIPGKGKGLVARTNIPIGTCIVAEAPIVDIPECDQWDLSTFENQINRLLPEAHVAAFNSLHIVEPHSKKFRKGAIVKDNGFLSHDQQSYHIFLTISRINHDCRPNGRYSWNFQKSEGRVYALRNISEGEEICIKYYCGGASETRWDLLKEGYNFDCECPLCFLPTSERKKSDDRLTWLEEVEKLGPTLVEKVEIEPDAILAASRYTLGILLEEGLQDQGLQWLLKDLFEICISHGDVARASIFAEAAAGISARISGSDNEWVGYLLEVSEDPTKAKAYKMFSDQWHTSLQQMPQFLEGYDLLDWLFANSRPGKPTEIPLCER